MSNVYDRLPKEPQEGSIPACSDCVLRDRDNPTYFSPMRLFTMDLSQSVLPKAQRRGTLIVRVGLSSQQDIEIQDPGTEELVTCKGVVLPVPCQELQGLDLLPETWEAIGAQGCPGSEEGQRRFLLFGPREASCGLLRLMQEQALNGT